VYMVKNWAKLVTSSMGRDSTDSIVVSIEIGGYHRLMSCEGFLDADQPCAERETMTHLHVAERIARKSEGGVFDVNGECVESESPSALDEDLTLGSCDCAGIPGTD